MAVALERFVENLIQSGLFSADELAAFQDRLPPEKRPKEPQGLARELIRAGKLEEAREHYAEAQRLAEQLRRDTTSVAHCYTPGAANAFVATRATGALEHLAKLLGQEENGTGPIKRQ